MSNLIYIAAQDDGSGGGKAKVCRPKAKWSSCTMGKGWAARRAAAKELQCSEQDVVLDPAPEVKASLYTASRRVKA